MTTARHYLVCSISLHPFWIHVWDHTVVIKHSSSLSQVFEQRFFPFFFLVCFPLMGSKQGCGLKWNEAQKEGYSICFLLNWQRYGTMNRGASKNQNKDWLMKWVSEVAQRTWRELALPLCTNVWHSSLIFQPERSQIVISCFATWDIDVHVK